MPNIDPTTRDSCSPVWDMSQERVSMETIFNQRFNFFLVFFSLVLAGAVNARSREHLVLVLGVGSVIALCLAYSLLRAHLKLGSVLDHLFADGTHPATIINNMHSKRLTVRWITGWLIPFGCTLALIVAATAAHQGELLPGSSSYDSQLQEVRSKSEALGREVFAAQTALAQVRQEVTTLRGAIGQRPNK